MYSKPLASLRAFSFAFGTALALCFSSAPLRAQTVILWSGAVNDLAAGAWGTTTNWTGSEVPDTATEQADLRRDWGGAVAGTPNITLGADRTINGLLFDDTGATGDRAMTINAGNSLIPAGLNPVIQVNGSTLLLSSPLGGAATWAKTGLGVLALGGDSSATFTGGILVNAGVLDLRQIGGLGDAATATTVNDGGQITFGNLATAATVAEPFIISGNGFGGTGALRVGGSKTINLSGTTALSADAQIRIDGSAGFNFTNPAGIAGTDRNLNFTIDGGGTGNVTGPLTLGFGGLTKASGGTLNLSSLNSYSGPTSVTGGILSIAGATGAILNTSSITALTGTLNLNNTADNSNRVTDSQAVNLTYGGGLSLTGNGIADTTETVGSVNLTGAGTLTVTSPAGRITTLAAASLVRATPQATALVRGTNLNQISATDAARITLTNGASIPMVGFTTLDGAPADDASPAVRIIPWMLGDASPTGAGSGFVTYDSTLGLRVLSTGQTVELTSDYTTAANPENAAVSADLTLDNVAGITVNSLLFRTVAASLNSAALQPLTINSGALATTANVATSIGFGFSEVLLGNGAGVITVASNTFTLNAPLNVSAGGGLAKAGGGTLALRAANLYTGRTSLNTGNIVFNTIGDVGSGPSSFGAPTTVANGTIDWSGGNLTYEGFGNSSDRVINLQLATPATAVSLFNNGSGMLTLSGGTTGTGTLVGRGTGNITLSGLLAHNGGLNRTDAFVLFVTNPNNSFPGALNISRGIINFETIADSGINCAIGAGSSITLGQSGFNNTGHLQYTGPAGGSSNRPINIQSNTGNTNGGIIENTVPGQTLTLSGAVTTGGTGAAPSLALNGDGDGVLSGNLSGTGLTVTKNGTGTWRITGTANTYTGATGVTNGLLHFSGTSQTLAALTLGGGPAGSTATMGTPADTINLNGNVTFSATNNPNGGILAAGTLNLGTAARTFTVGNSNAAASDLTVTSLITGTGGLTKAGTGVLTLPTANAFTGPIQITGAANPGNTLRIEHAEALGPVATPKTVTLTGSNRAFSILELANNITIDATKVISTSGKSYQAVEDSNLGSPVFLQNASGNNTWLGNIIIGAAGGAYSIESNGGTLTLGSDPATASVIRNDVLASTRVVAFRGPGNIVVHHRFVPNGTGLTGLLMQGSGTLTLTRTDNDFAAVPSLASGTTIIESLANSTSPSSLGTGTGVNFGGTLRHVGTADSSSARTLQFIGTSPVLESSGTGTLSLTSANIVTYNNGGASTAAAFTVGATALTLTDVWSLMPGMGIAGRGLEPGTVITAVDYDARQVTLDKPTTLTTLGGRALPLSVAGVIGDTFLTLSVANASVPNLFVGMNVTATGIPANTTITSIDTITGVIGISNGLTAAIALAANVNFNSGAITVSGGNAVNRTFTLGGTNSGDNTFSLSLVNPSAAVLSVVKANAGRWILTGFNSYTGNTTILDGTLSLTSPNLADTSTLTIGTTAASPSVLDLPNEGTDVVAALVIDGVARPAGLYDSVNSGGAITGLGKIEVLGTADPYTTWIDGYTPDALLPDAASKLPTADPDKDGLNNLLEFVLDGSPVAASPAIAPSQTVTATDIILTFKRSDASEAPATTQTVEISTDLTDWTTIPAIPIGAVSAGAVTVVEGAGAAPDDITVLIPRNGSVKRYVRLKVVK